MRKPTKPEITAEELLAWQGDRTMTDCAKLMRTPRRTYVGWVRREVRIPGIVAAFIELDNAKHRRKKKA